MFKYMHEWCTHLFRSTALTLGGHTWHLDVHSDGCTTHSILCLIHVVETCWCGIQQLWHHHPRSAEGGCSQQGISPSCFSCYIPRGTEETRMPRVGMSRLAGNREEVTVLVSTMQGSRKEWWVKMTGRCGHSNQTVWLSLLRCEISVFSLVLSSPFCSCMSISSSPLYH